MQGQRSTGSFSETSNTDPESISDNTGINEQAYWNNLWNPVESRFSFYGGVGSDPQTFRGMDAGEPSSRSNAQNHVNDDPMEVDHGWGFSYDPNSRAGPEPANTPFPGRFNMGPISDQVMRRPLFLRSSSPAPQNANESSPAMGAVGTASGGPDYVAEENLNNGGGSSSSSDWGLSYKRKALEGTSRQPYDGESSSSSRYNASGGLSLSPPSWNSVTENPARSIGLRLSQGTRHDPIPFNLSSMGSARRLNLPLPHLSARPIPSGDSSYSTASGDGGGSSSAPQGQSRVTRLPRNMHPWNGSSNSRAGTSIEGAALQDEPNLRTISRNNVEHDPTNWSLATTGHISSTGGVPSSSRAGPSSSARHNSQMRNRQPIGDFFPDQSLFPSVDSELGGYSGQLPQFPSGSSSRETAMSSRLRHACNRPYPRPAFLVEAHSDDDDEDDDDLEPPSLRDLAVDIEGRHRLISEQIRHVLGAMRRGENLRAEDFMLVDPFIYHGMADLHDRHRDMRLDVDNMSYEELLALGERIGDVSTGLSGEAISKSMKQRQFMSFATETPTDLEPCCICQEQYVDGDDLGTLDCGHDFHTDCVKQWLMQKNLCPICKTKALQT